MLSKYIVEEALDDYYKFHNKVLETEDVWFNRDDDGYASISDVLWCTLDEATDFIQYRYDMYESELPSFEEFMENVFNGDTLGLIV